MMKFLLGTTMFAGLMVAGAAQAADLKAPAYKAPQAPFYYNWGGCYIGGQAGWARARSDLINTANTTFFGDVLPGDGFRVSDSGGIAGGQIGCNFQSGQWVFGLEGQGSWLGVKTSFLNTFFGTTDDNFEVKSNWLASVAGRVGFANNNWLFYAKGGFAASGWRVSVTDVVGPNVGSGSDKHTHTGFVVGTGIEYGLTQNWIFGVEYDYYSFSKESYQLNGTEPANRSYAFDFKPQNVHAVVGRISYKFY